MKKRDAGSAPALGDRVAYVIVYLTATDYKFFADMCYTKA
jgi:hypothetical protein